MQLEQIDPIGFQPLQRRIGSTRDRFRRKILRNFALAAAAILSVRDEVVANLCRNDDLVSLFWKSFGNQFFTAAISVGVGGIEKRHAQIERLMHEADRLAFSEIAPPASRDCPKTKADRADG